MSQSDQSPEGREGTLVLATRGPDGPGEVAVAIRGGREIFTAHSATPIAAGENVLVTGVLGARAVTVIAWPRLVSG